MAVSGSTVVAECLRLDSGLSVSPTDSSVTTSTTCLSDPTFGSRRSRVWSRGVGSERVTVGPPDSVYGVVCLSFGWTGDRTTVCGHVVLSVRLFEVCGLPTPVRGVDEVEGPFRGSGLDSAGLCTYFHVHTLTHLCGRGPCVSVRPGGAPFPPWSTLSGFPGTLVSGPFVRRVP